MKRCMDTENLHKRLKKIIGQVNAIDRMIDEEMLQSQRCIRLGRSFWKDICSIVYVMELNMVMRIRQLLILQKR